MKAFSDCIRENLKDRRFGKERADEIIGNFEQRAKLHEASGKSESDAALLAMRETFDSMSKAAEEKAKRTAKQLAVQAASRDRIAAGMKIDVSAFTAKDLAGNQIGPRGSRGKALAHAVMSMIAPDKRFKSVSSYEMKRDITYRQLFQLMSDALEPVRKGAFGFQHGKAHINNVVYEIYGRDTGDVAAKNLAKAWQRTDDMAVELFNQAGGSLTPLKNYFPTPVRNIAKIIKGGEASFIDGHNKWLDWDKTRYPNGDPIPVEKRSEFLTEVYKTKSSDGANKIDDTKMRGQGRAMGNMLEQHRLLHYKDGAAWLEAHKLYGDGNPFDIISHQVSNMSHHIAAVDTFGPNPELGFENMVSIAKKTAYDNKLSRTEITELDDLINNKVRPMFNIDMRKNPMNTEGLIAATTTTISNVLSSAYLGGASIPAMFGDFATSAVVKSYNNLGALSGMDTYMKALAVDQKFQRRMMAQTGFIAEQHVSYLNGAERYNPLITMGDKYSRFLADTVMRASLNTPHTTAARWSIQAEFMGALHDFKDKPFADNPLRGVMERYGITEQDWKDFTSNTKTFSPRKDVEFLSPVHILDSKLKNKQQLFEKFQGMILEESNTAVPTSRTESRVTLKGETRPDTLAGVLLHSFGTFKNFPVSFFTIIGRAALAHPRASTRLGFYAATAAATTVGGLFAVQMNELRHGRTPMPLYDSEGKPNMKLFGKAFMTSGGAGIWGDFLFAGVNSYGQGPQDVAAGPLVDIFGDVTQIVAGDIPNDIMNLFDKGTGDSKTLQHLVSLGRKVQPGANLWQLELIFQRIFWDSIEDIVDPSASSKRYQREQKRKREYGNSYWWHLGDKKPEFSR